MVRIKEIKISIHRKYTKDFQSYGYRIGLQLEIGQTDGARSGYYEGKAFLNERIAEEDLIIKNIMDKRVAEKKSGYKELDFVPEGGLIAKKVVGKGTVGYKELVGISKVENIMYDHKCDDCGRLFVDNRGDMEHYADDNGEMLCNVCCKKVDRSKLERGDMGGAVKVLEKRELGGGGGEGNVLIPLDVRQIKKTSSMAVLVELFGKKGDLWIPKSCIGDGDAMDLMQKGVKTMLRVKNWFLEKSGLI